MARYLYQGRYNDDGCRGIVAEGGSGREAETVELFAMLGGEVETYLFAVGPDFDARVLVGHLLEADENLHGETSP